MTTRLQRQPFLALFDGPDTNTSTSVRSDSIVPGQALYLMNSDAVRRVAESFARRLLETDPTQRLRRACRLAYQREPTDVESKRMTHFLAAYGDDTVAAWTALCRVLLTSHEFLLLGITSRTDASKPSFTTQFHSTWGGFDWVHRRDRIA